MSDQTLGSDNGEPYFTNEAQLTSSAVTANMRLWGYRVCADGDSFQGLQFILSEKDYSEPIEDFETETLVLDPIGIMEGDCSQEKLSAPLRAIKAMIHDDRIDGLKVNYLDGNKLEFGEGMKKGTLGEDKQWWPIALSAPVIGIYGHHGDRGIEKLGFIILDEQCQMALDAVEEPVEDEDDEGDEGVIEVDDLNEPVKEEQEEIVETVAPEVEPENTETEVETAPEAVEDVDGEAGEVVTEEKTEVISEDGEGAVNEEAEEVVSGEGWEVVIEDIELAESLKTKENEDIDDNLSENEALEESEPALEEGVQAPEEKEQTDLTPAETSKSESAGLSTMA